MTSCRSRWPKFRREIGELAERSAKEEQAHAERLAGQERDHGERLAKQEREARERLEKETRHERLEAESLAARLEAMRQQVVVTEETALLQEVGVYQYRHPLTDAVAYQAELARLQDQIKTMARRDGGAVLADTSWTVNGSAAQGRSMIRDYSKLMLRAYNAEADNLVRALKPTN